MLNQLAVTLTAVLHEKNSFVDRTSALVRYAVAFQLQYRMRLENLKKNVLVDNTVLSEYLLIKSRRTYRWYDGLAQMIITKGVLLLLLENLYLKTQAKGLRDFSTGQAGIVHFERSCSLFLVRAAHFQGRSFNRGYLMPCIFVPDGLKCRAECTVWYLLEIARKKHSSLSALMASSCLYWPGRPQY